MMGCEVALPRPYDFLIRPTAALTRSLMRTVPPVRPNTVQETPMPDLILVGLVAGAFALLAGYAAACARL